MHASSAGTPDLARHLDLQVRTQERQLVTVRLAVVALAVRFLITLGEPIANRFAPMAVLAGVGMWLPRIATPVQQIPPDEAEAPRFMRRSTDE